MDVAGVAFAGVVEAIRLVHGTVQRCRQLATNRESLEQLANRLEVLERSLATQQTRNAPPSATWSAAVDTMKAYVVDKVVPFLDGMATRPAATGLSRVRAVAKANWEAEMIRSIAKRLDELTLDLSFQVNVDGFANVNDKVGDVQDALDAVQDDMGTVLRRMLIIEKLIKENTAAKAASADDFLREVHACAKDPSIAQKESSAVASYHGQKSARKQALLLASAPAAPASPALLQSLPARIGPIAAAAAAGQDAKPLQVPESVEAAYQEVVDAPLPIPVRSVSEQDAPPAPGSTVTVASELAASTRSRSTGGSDGVGGSVDDEYLMIMSMRERLGPQVEWMLTSLSQNSALPQEDRTEVREVLRALWEPWRIARDKIQYVYRNGAKRILGTGGYGRVYMASIESADGTRQKVAVKELEGVFTDVKYKADFEREVALLRDLSHPCIISFVGAAWPELRSLGVGTAGEGTKKAVVLDNDSGDDEEEDDDTEEKTAIIVTERMSCNLAAARQGGLLDDDRLKAAAMLDVAEGMVYLHSKRVVHMDIKPENILCRTKTGPDGKKMLDGRAKISDFGVSQTKRDTSSRTMTRVAGTKLFMAPELMRKGRKLRLASDVWSFGVMLVSMFADLVEVECLNDDDISAEANNGTLHIRFQSSIRRIVHLGVQMLTSSCLVNAAADRPTFVGIRNVLRAIVNGDPIERVQFCLDHGCRDHLFNEGIKMMVGSDRGRGIEMMNRAVGLVPARPPAIGLVSYDSDLSNALRVLPPFVVQAIEWNEAGLRCNMKPRGLRAMRALLLHEFLVADKCADLLESPAVNAYLARYCDSDNAATTFFAGLVMYRSSKKTRNPAQLQAAHRLFMQAYTAGDPWGGVFLSAMLSDAAANGVPVAALKVKPILDSGTNWNCCLSLDALGAYYWHGSFDTPKDLHAAQLCFTRAIELGEHYLAPLFLARLLHANRAHFGAHSTSEENVVELCGKSIASGNVEAARFAAAYYASQGKLAQAESFVARALAMGDRDGVSARLAMHIAKLRLSSAHRESGVSPM